MEAQDQDQNAEPKPIAPEEKGVKPLSLMDALDPEKDFPIKPFNLRVIILPDPIQEYTKGGIIIPPSSKEPSRLGTIVAVAAGDKDNPMIVEPGDRVVYSEVAGTDLVIGEVTFRVMRQTELIGKLTIELEDHVTVRCQHVHE